MAAISLPGRDECRGRPFSRSCGARAPRSTRARRLPRASPEETVARARAPPSLLRVRVRERAQDLLGKTVVVVGLGYVPTSVSRAFKRVRRARASLLSTLPTVANPPTP